MLYNARHGLIVYRIMRRNSDYANKNFSFNRVRHGIKAFTCSLALLTALGVFYSKDASSMDLARFEWKNRLLFIFAPDRRHPHLKQIQSEISSRRPDVEDRDLLIFEVLENDPSRMHGSTLNQSDADALRERFEITPNTFVLILVGKDGGVKLKRNERVSVSEIFESIDAMPMRRDEMRQKNQ